MTVQRHQGRFASPGRAIPAPLLTARPEVSKAAAIIGSLGGKAAARKVRGRTLLVADMLRAELGMPPVEWPRA